MTSTQPQINLPSQKYARKYLQLLTDIFVERDAQLERIEDIDNDEINEESTFLCSLFDVFYDAGGSKAINDMTTFDAAELQTVWNILTDVVD